MSHFARLDYNLNIALANQEARHAAEDGRDIARERCIEAMASAYIKNCRCMKQGDAVYYDGLGAALDAAIASGYVVVNKIPTHS